jgi:hypothetical protein
MVQVKLKPLNVGFPLVLRLVGFYCISWTHSEVSDESVSSVLAHGAKAGSSRAHLFNGANQQSGKYRSMPCRLKYQCA